MIKPNFRWFKKPNKKSIRNTYENKSNHLCFGSFGLQVLEQGFLTIEQIETIRRTITNRLKRKGKVWIRAYPDYPRTAKPKEVRMGRGKGNVNQWTCIMKPGRILFEVDSNDKNLIKETLLFTIRKIPLFVQVIERII